MIKTSLKYCTFISLFSMLYSRLFILFSDNAGYLNSALLFSPVFKTAKTSILGISLLCAVIYSCLLAVLIKINDYFNFSKKEKYWGLFIIILFGIFPAPFITQEIAVSPLSVLTVLLSIIIFFPGKHD